MSKSRLFIFGALGFLGGVLLASLYPVGWLLLGSCSMFSAIVFALCRANGWLKALGLVLLCAGLGAARLNLSLVPNEYNNLLGKKREWEGVIVADIDVRPDRQQFTFQPDGFSQRLLVVTTHGQDLFYGDRVWITGRADLPKVADEFDYAAYLERFHTYGIIRYPKIIVLRQHQGSWAREQLLRLKTTFVRRLSGFLGEPHSSLMAGILIGARKTLPDTVINNFNLTGTSHIIAISGYNISIIAAALEPLRKYLGPKLSFIAAMTIILGFVVMSGAGASVVRASIMGGLCLIAAQSGRQYTATPSLLFSAGIMVLHNPRILLWDASFQLSFAATIGIVYFLPLLEQLASNWSFIPGSVSSAFLGTMAALIPTLPLILILFGRLSLVAPLVNVLVLPVIPLVMLLGFLTAVPWLGAGFGWIASLLLSYILKVTASFAGWEHAAVDLTVSRIMFWPLALGVALFYLILMRLAGKTRRPLAGQVLKQIS